MKALLDRLFFGILLFCWFVTLFMSQASSPNYQTLFWRVMPFAAAHIALVIYFIVRTSGIKPWLLAFFSAPAVISFLDMTCRVWLHVRLL
ncbi:hypothetical protein [Prosthecobacter sp.]|uniref:hypothetical protein n=1 Tax=Prosthecobacter sp. TaxID=1965333 RepID=UPI0025F76711|nr:hypothetical protein [Prosthecobacter sp.]